MTDEANRLTRAEKILTYTLLFLAGFILVVLIGGFILLDHMVDTALRFQPITHQRVTK